MMTRETWHFYPLPHQMRIGKNKMTLLQVAKQGKKPSHWNPLKSVWQGNSCHCSFLPVIWEERKKLFAGESTLSKGWIYFTWALALGKYFSGGMKASYPASFICCPYFMWKTIRAVIGRPMENRLAGLFCSITVRASSSYAISWFSILSLLPVSRNLKASGIRALLG